jgi:hypothetical protein
MCGCRLRNASHKCRDLGSELNLSSDFWVQSDAVKLMRTCGKTLISIILVLTHRTEN